MDNFIRAEDIFDEDNTRWETEEGRQYLVYMGSMEELAKEYNITEDRAYELLGEYEDMSKDLIDTEREIMEARKGEY